MPWRFHTDFDSHVPRCLRRGRSGTAPEGHVSDGEVKVYHGQRSIQGTAKARDGGSVPRGRESSPTSPTPSGVGTMRLPFFPTCRLATGGAPPPFPPFRRGRGVFSLFLPLGRQETGRMISSLGGPGDWGRRETLTPPPTLVRGVG